MTNTELWCLIIVIAIMLWCLLGLFNNKVGGMNNYFMTQVIGGVLTASCALSLGGR